MRLRWKILCWFLLLLLLLPLPACSPSPYSEQLYGMDTLVRVTLYGVGAEKGADILNECRRMLTEWEARWSAYREESLIAEFNRSETGGQNLDTRTEQWLRTAMAVSEATEGAFDLTVAPLITLWSRCEEEGRLPSSEELASSKALCDSTGWSIENGTLIKHRAAIQLDPGGVAKGAAISALLEYLKTTDATGGLVSFGSNVAVFGVKPDGEPFRVAIRNPKNASESVGRLPLGDGEILSVSGDYERFFTIGETRYHHILDPHTGYPSDSGLSSVAVICSDGALADALSTALLVMGEHRAVELYTRGAFEFEYILIASDGATVVSDGLRSRFERY